VRHSPESSPTLFLATRGVIEEGVGLPTRKTESRVVAPCHRFAPHRRRMGIKANITALVNEDGIVPPWTAGLMALLYALVIGIHCVK
jgi:hypothetical protein